MKNRLNQCLQVINQYGGAAKTILPQLREIEEKLKAHRDGRKSLKSHIEKLEKLIAKIVVSKETIELRSIN